ncbi:MAG: pantoate--beta-alanine ligase [Bacteroidetes bacterium]|nr:MAG: pantoate--beta-alanine ligase [Bacteroidota bacterium]
MKVFSTVYDLQSQITKLHLIPVGFVPTMGALHEGHLSLVRSAVSKCPLVVVSIYVNPTQFNDKNDLKNYPGTIENDLIFLEKVLRETDIVFTPDDKEIYPEEDKRVFHFGNLDNVMEALYRPGHFNGVAQVVSRLFEIVKPDIALFGLKDFQQLAVIKELVRQTKSKIKILGNPIVRENDGLAMSSRNMLLEPGIRKNASVIFKTISNVSSMISEKDIPEIKTFVENSIGKIDGFKVEYFDIVDDTELIPVSKRSEMQKGKRYFGCIAVKAGKIRLIDNIEIGLV